MRRKEQVAVPALNAVLADLQVMAGHGRWRFKFSHSITEAAAAVKQVGLPES